MEPTFSANDHFPSATHLNQSYTPFPIHSDVMTSDNSEASQETLYFNSDNTFKALSLEEPESSSPQTNKHLMMPSFDSTFWHTYGNKLRVNGTIEEVCNTASSLVRPSSVGSLEGLQPPGFWVP